MYVLYLLFQNPSNLNMDIFVDNKNRLQPFAWAMVKHYLKSQRAGYVSSRIHVSQKYWFLLLLLQLCFAVCIVIWSLVGFVVGQIRTLKVWIYFHTHPCLYSHAYDNRTMDGLLMAPCGTGSGGSYIIAGINFTFFPIGSTWWSFSPLWALSYTVLPITLLRKRL